MTKAKGKTVFIFFSLIFLPESKNDVISIYLTSWDDDVFWDYFFFSRLHNNIYLLMNLYLWREEKKKKR